MTSAASAKEDPTAKSGQARDGGSWADGTRYSSGTVTRAASSRSPPPEPPRRPVGADGAHARAGRRALDGSPHERQRELPERRRLWRRRRARREPEQAGREQPPWRQRPPSSASVHRSEGKCRGPPGTHSCDGWIPLQSQAIPRSPRLRGARQVNRPSPPDLQPQARSEPSAAKSRAIPSAQSSTPTPSGGLGVSDFGAGISAVRQPSPFVRRPVHR